MRTIQDCHYLSPEHRILDAIQKINDGAIGIVLVLSEDRRLLGTVTDGDIRRGLLKGLTLESKVNCVMKQDCFFAQNTTALNVLKEMARKHRLFQIPIVDENGCAIALASVEDWSEKSLKTYPNEVIIMAGGMGQRLMPLTQNTPKPMLNVGDKPILETIIRNFSLQGFKKFTIAVNYLSEQIVDYFEDGKCLGVEIDYVKENQRMGTAGALSLLGQKPNVPFFVINGDLLTNVNFAQLMEFHIQSKAIATMSVKQYSVEVPYGVVKVSGHYVTSLEEKPMQNFFINAGIYVLSPDFLQHIPQGISCDMPNILNEMVKLQHKVSCFPIWEKWIDIGRHEDFAKATGEFQQILS